MATHYDADDDVLFVMMALVVVLMEYGSDGAMMAAVAL
jgi:hypothetical protein